MLFPDELDRSQEYLAAGKHVMLVCRALGCLHWKWEAVIRQPRLKAVLLQLSPALAKARVRHLQLSVCGGDAKLAMSLAARQPSILLEEVGVISSRLCQLHTILAASPQQQAAPGAKPQQQATLTASSQQAAVAEGMAEVARLVLQAPALLVNKTCYGDVLTALSKSMHVEPWQLGGLVQQHPELLSRPDCDGFSAVMDTLSDLLGLRPAEATQLVLREPCVLLGSSEIVRRNLTCILVTFDLDAGTLREMVEHVPELLSTSPGVLPVRCQRLMKLLKSSASWRKQVGRLMSQPRNLAVAVSFNTAHYDRLDYLVTTQRDTGISYKEVGFRL